MKTIYLVTGATGHLGNVIVSALMQRRQQVRVLVHPRDMKRENVHPRAEVFVGDVKDIESMEDFFTVSSDRRTIVIHAAELVSIASKYDKNLYEVNVNGTKNILRLCRKYQVEKMIYVSTVHAIPELAKGETIQEVNEFDPNKVVGWYAKTKAVATRMVLDVKKHGVCACVVHPTGIVGPCDYGRGYLTQLIVDYMKGRLTAAVEGGYDFVDVRDVADGILSCCANGRRGECYILSNKYFSIETLLAMLHRITGKKPVRTILPDWFANSTGYLAETCYKFLKQPPLYTPYSLYTLKTNALFSHMKADRELLYSVRPMESTLADTIEWLRIQGRI